MGKEREPRPSPGAQFTKSVSHSHITALHVETQLGKSHRLCRVFLPLCCFYEHFLLG